MAELVVYPQLKYWRPYSEAKSALEASRNCAASTGAAAANYGASQPSLVSHHDFRLAAGNPKKADGSPAGLSTLACERALHGYGVNAERHAAESIELVREALQEPGVIVLLAVHYGTINERFAEYSGDRRFDGEHAVVVQGYRRRDPRIGNRNSTTWHDPLADGRCRDWGCAPRGPQLAPFRMARLAAGEFRPDSKTPLGPGLATFTVVTPAP